MTYLVWIVLLGTSLLGAVAGVLGSFAVLRRRALAGDVVAHAALPGLCLAFLVFGQRHFLGMLVGAFLAGLAGLALVAVIRRWTRTRDDAAMGIVLGTFFGLGIVLSSVIQNREGGGGKSGLETYLYGQAAGMALADLVVIAAAALFALSLVVLAYKELLLLSFDPEFARTQGWPTLLLDLGLMALLALVTVIGLPAVGVVLMAAMLILPGAAARFWTDRLGPMLLLAGVLGALPGALGALLSAGVIADLLGFDPLAFGAREANLPTGPLVVLSGTLMFLVSALFAPRRGALARLAALVRLRAHAARENLLRSLYELGEARLPGAAAIPLERLRARRSWSRLGAAALVRWVAWQGLVETRPEGIALTLAGLEQARRLVRAHRLWERFLIERADIAPDHVDRDADLVEHLLDDASLAELALPAEEMPQSPHALDADRRP